MKKQLIADAIKDSLDNVARLELFNAYLYNAGAAVAQSAGWQGLAKKFNRESDEEVKHHRAAVDFLNSRGCTFTPSPISSPVIEGGLKEMVTAAYDQECFTEQAYVSLGALALSLGDLATYQFVMEVLDHQVPSTGEYADWMARIELAANNEAALLLIDQEIGNV